MVLDISKPTIQTLPELEKLGPMCRYMAKPPGELTLVVSY